MKAVVLAAGKGTRMREITNSIPKPMVEIGGRPMLWHILQALGGAGVREAAVVVGYMGDSIRSYFGDGAEVGVGLSYFVQKVQDGTGRAADPAREFVADDPFFLTFGDILTEPEAYALMAGKYQSAPTDLLMAVRWVEDPHRGGAVYVDGDRIEKIIEKPAAGESTTHWINAGICISSPVLYDYTARLELSERGEYELPDAFRMMIADGRAVRAFELSSYWRDVGTPEDLAEAGRDVGEQDDIL